MTDKDIKTVVESTEKEFEKKKLEQQKEAIKEIVQQTLEKIERLDNQIKELEDEKRILKLDIEDMKNGKLDLIEERQRKSEKARNTSLVIIKEIHKEYVPTPWYQPYYVVPNPISWPQPVVWCGGTTITNNTAGVVTTTNTSSCDLSNGMTFTCSAVKDNTIGAYEISGHIVNLR
jgi:hypothetical protein